MRNELSERIRPFTDQLADDLADLVATRIESVVASTLASIDEAFGVALSALASESQAPGGADMVPAEPIASPKAKRTRAVTPAVKRPVVATSGKMTCKKCGFVGGNARGCGRSHPTQGREIATPAAKRAASDDSEDEPRAPRTRPSRGDELAQELPVIPHATLVAMLYADRANNAVGDTGGTPLRADAGPSLIGHTDEKRELCPIHGWVGRVAFEREQHGLCSGDGAACTHCEGRKVVVSGFCRHCGGSGIEPVEVQNDSGPLTKNQAAQIRWRIRHGQDVPPERRAQLEEYDRARAASRPIAADGVQILSEIDEDGSRHRTRTAPRSFTIARKSLTRAVLADYELEVERAGPAVDESRPKTRGDCEGMDRPCPYVACKHHLFLDVDVETGSIKFNFPDVEPEEMRTSCSLDVADAGPQTLEDVGNLMNITRERARQVETKALHAAKALIVESEDAA